MAGLYSGRSGNSKEEKIIIQGQIFWLFPGLTRRYTYDLTLCRFHLGVTAMERQQCILRILLNYM